MKAKRMVLFFILICFCAVVIVGVNIYAKNFAPTGTGADSQDGAYHIDSEGSSREAEGILMESPIEDGSQIQEDALGTDVVGGTSYIGPDGDGEDVDRTLLETPFDQ